MATHPLDTPASMRHDTGYHIRYAIPKSGPVPDESVAIWIVWAADRDAWSGGLPWVRHWTVFGYWT
jgi:hypothetical protein